MLRAAFVPLVAGSLLAACSGGDSGSVPPTTPVPPTPPKVTVQVIRTSGVTGTPAAGSIQVDSGTVVSYSFSLSAGYQDLQVYLDTVPVPATGTVSTVTGSHVLRAIAIPTPVQVAGPAATAVITLYGGRDPVSGFGTLVSTVRTAILSGDTSTLATLRKAEYAALLQGGPQALEGARAALAGETYVVFGETEAERDGFSRVRTATRGAALRPEPASPGRALFAPDTVAPTTVIYVNGILNFTASQAAGSAGAILQMLGESGFNAGSIVTRDKAAARPGTAMRVLYHFNPVVDLSSERARCLRALDWAAETARLAEPNQDDESWSSRVRLLLGSVKEKFGEVKCAFSFSTNARVVDEYLESLFGELGTLSANDETLVWVIGQERGAGGGRNVIVLGHSQGTLIARAAIGSSSPPSPDAGCLGGMAVASPAGTGVAWPNTQALYRVIAHGSAGLAWDILYPLGLPRTDGAPSGFTDRLESDMTKVLWNLTHYRTLEFLRLHSFSTYTAPEGYRAQIAGAMVQEYRVLGHRCGGTLTGSVYDLGTAQPVSGASVRVLMNGVQRSSIVSRTDGGFATDTLFPTLHDLTITAPGYDTVQLAQRLVPFNRSAPVQSGPVYLAKPCVAGGCVMQGVYAVHYVLSGTEGGYPTSCTFNAQMVLTQRDSAYSGSVTTSAYQSGCHMPDGHYIEWGAGTNPITGTIRGSAITMVHPARPTWYPAGRAFQGGFQATEPAWYPGGSFTLRVEISATRLRDATAADLTAARAAAGQRSDGASGGPHSANR